MIYFWFSFAQVEIAHVWVFLLQNIDDVLRDTQLGKTKLHATKDSNNFQISANIPTVCVILHATE